VTTYHQQWLCYQLATETGFLYAGDEILVTYDNRKLNFMDNYFSFVVQSQSVQKLLSKPFGM
jgi:hypothetical protein